MSLMEVYPRIKPSVVAFVARYLRNKPTSHSGSFPLIIGTGFIVDEAGIILTNDHVIEAFSQCPKQEGENDFDAVKVLLFHQEGSEMFTPALDILTAARIDSFTPSDPFFQRHPPDLALVGVSLKGLPTCNIRLKTGGIEEGMEIATAGFPMGVESLVSQADGHLQQLSPVLQRGIVSAVQPFAVPNLVSFTINILLQNGASGSPVFDTNSGEVLGVAYLRKYESAVGNVLTNSDKRVLSQDGEPLKSVMNMPTNYSFVVPTYHLGENIDKLKEGFLHRIRDRQMNLEEYFKTMKPIDYKTGTIHDSIEAAREGGVVVKRMGI